MSNKITTISHLIDLYYKVCDNWIDYMPKEITPTQIATYRGNVINSIYILIYNRMPLDSDTFTLMRVLNNDISGKRLTPEQIISRFKVKE